ncbi:MAG: AAA family ATPase [Rothia sp. (in: high G+C Gram-positive bacteria)]|uniref:AAA family ATPase n=1 Tax=Rothia sp. (in: high G+C Gram-positive bacteria) TaxID=1885016 RepID=UPI0026FFC449|nr:AAA family ATPase [Rothia sp. (in: high G+C Gram-positive bacteria)]
MVFNDLPLRSITARGDFEPLTDVRAHTWPYCLAVTRAALAGLIFGRLTVIVGENGAGKSSLVESIAEAYGLPLGGGDNRVARPIFEPSSAFGADLQIVRGAAGRRAGLFLRAEGMLAHLEHLASLKSKQATDILHLSHGEGTQRLLEESFEDYGLWILDEPESGLSFSGQLELCARVLAFLERGGQVVLCTHSPLLAALAAHRNELVWEIGEWGVRQLAWAELDMTIHWRNMLDDPEMYLHHLG